MKMFVLYVGLFFLIVGGDWIAFAADGDWRNGFDRICVQTANAGSLSNKDLERLINESDELLAVIELVDDPDKKVYLSRLRKCRNFFSFMMQIGGVSALK